MLRRLGIMHPLLVFIKVLEQKQNQDLLQILNQVIPQENLISLIENPKKPRVSKKSPRWVNYSKKDNDKELPDKEKTNEFFKDSKIGSCSHVLVKNGNSVAVPFKVTNTKGRGLMSFKIQPSLSSEVQSIYRKDYSVHSDMHVGMTKKPLVPYNPTSYRNRLPTSTVIMPHKNKSVVEIGDRGTVNRKQWTSSAMDNYKNPKILPISNTGIISDMTIRAHKKINE